MESFPEIVRQIVLCLFTPLLGACVLAWVLLQLPSPGSRKRSKLGKSVCAGLVALAIACTTLTGKNTNGVNGVGGMFLMQFNPPAVLSVTPEDISNGWRVAEVSDAGAFAPPPANAVTNELWRLRGAHDDAFRIPADGWSYPFASGVTVLSRGAIRRDIRSRDFPRAFEQDLSLLPVVNWQFLPDGRNESVFWHGSTPSNTLIATWWNAALGRDATNPVCFQAELYTNGGFDYRYEDRTVRHVRVWPFDLDDDGLENSVDPDPLVAGPDAHGTNAEWYNVVCSNVLEAVEGDGSAGTPRPTLSWLDGVNSNAYYFVDVVTTNCLAPIYFTGDRESRLGNPVVVARGGETNHVPLLIGINYAVTSTVPFTVSIPDDGFASVTTNGVSNYAVQWPLEFTVAPDGTGYRASAGPYDPGCEFLWDQPTRSVTCNYTTDGAWIGFNCHGAWGCECGGCSVSGVAMLEDVEFDLPDVWCGCWHYDPLNPEIGLVFTNLPYVAVSFDNHVVFYEDAYTNAPNDVVAKHSTNTTLTVFAYGGDAGGMLYVSAQKIEKLVRVGGKSISFPYTAFVPPQSGVSFSIEYEAETHSDSERDITVTASLIPGDGGGTISDSASATAVKIDFKPEVHLSRFLQHRHVVGVNELAQLTWKPNSVSVGLRANGGGQVHDNNGYYYYRAPLIGVAPGLVATCQYSEFELAVSIIEPMSVVVTNVFAYNYNVPTNDAGGAGMGFDMYILPTNVSFMDIAVMEVPSEYMDPQGYFANPYFDYAWAHTTDMKAGVWHNIGVGNFFMQDCTEMGDRIPRIKPNGETSFEPIYGWIVGSMNWRIPVGWNCRNSEPGDPALKEFMVYWQSFRMSIEGTLEVEKLSNTVQRATNSVIRLNGVVQTLEELRVR